MMKDFKPYYDLLFTADDMLNYKIDEWKGNKFYMPDAPKYEDIYKNVIESSTKCGNLFKFFLEENPETADVCQIIKERIDDFRQYLPLIRNLKSEAIQDDDWELIMKAVQKENVEKDDLSLQNMIDEGFLSHLNEIEEIVSRAQKKLSLREKLTQLKKEIKDFKLELFPYKDTFVLKGYDDIYTILDD